MKKYIYILLCMAMLTGCSNAETAADKKAPSEASAAASEVSEEAVPDCEWVDNSHSYKTEEEFLSVGVAKMGYYNSDCTEKLSITPYTVDYDEEKYELVQIMAIAEYEYFYVLNDKETFDQVSIIFHYEDGMSDIEDIYLYETYQRKTVDFNGTPNMPALFDKSTTAEKITFIAGDDCSVSIKYSQCTSVAVAASAESEAVSVTDLLSDFTISEA